MQAKKTLLLILVVVGWLSNLTFAQDSTTVKLSNDSTVAKLPDDSTAWLNSDTVNIKFKKHSPTKATLYSLVIPGLGQAYNKQYLKIPVIYGIGALLITQIVSNEYDYVQAGADYKIRVRNVSANDDRYKKGSPSYPDTYDYYDPLNPARKEKGFNGRSLTTDQLRLTRDGFRRDRDFYVIVTTLVYALNVIDATVFAHLREFEVSEKLTMKIDPQIRFAYGSSHPIPGISCSLHFK